MKTAFHPLAVMLTFAGRAGRGYVTAGRCPLVEGSELPQRAPSCDSLAECRELPQARSCPRGPNHRRHHMPGSSPFHLIAVSTHHPPFLNSQLEILSWKLENLVLDNSVLWIPQITKLLFQMFIARILIVPSLHSRVISVPQNTLRWLHPVAGIHKLIFDFRTLCSEEISGGSTNVKHTTGSSCRSPAPRLPIWGAEPEHHCPTQPKRSFGQMRPNTGLHLPVYHENPYEH